MLGLVSSAGSDIQRLKLELSESGVRSHLNWPFHYRKPTTLHWVVTSRTGCFPCCAHDRLLLTVAQSDFLAEGKKLKSKI
ncbi:hypothetical protein RRG08_032245 [Elysia crispata]|uniref:Uncharacterized protein n=1 Tax=Elysia crispata TaxID=231223 RepID=A0AAE1AZI1_9GAST|nr:hypothetical protein RRG08_032245 [Elysia crispata]